MAVFQARSLADAAFSEAAIACTPPLFPEVAAEATMQPRIEFLERRLCFAETEIELHPGRGNRERRNHLLGAHPRVRLSCGVFRLEACYGLLARPAAGSAASGEGKSQKRPLPGTVDRTLRYIDSKLELPFQKLCHTGHHPTPGSRECGHRCCSHPHSGRSDVRDFRVPCRARQAADWLAVGKAGPPVACPSGGLVILLSEARRISETDVSVR